MGRGPMLRKTRGERKKKKAQRKRTAPGGKAKKRMGINVQGAEKLH